MYVHMNKVESGSHGVADQWEPYRGKYPDPTPEEFNLIEPFLCKFAWEHHVHDFNESGPHWISLKNRLRCPNLRYMLNKFLRQVRGSKGYDVDLYFDFIAHPYTVFLPRSLDDKKFYDEAMAASTFAIGEINSCMMAVGKSYKLVSVDKLVSASMRRVIEEEFGGEEVELGNGNGNGNGNSRPIVVININMLLLTFSATENESEKEKEKEDGVISFQAMLQVCDQEHQPSSTLQLKEWKFKPQ